MSLKIIKGGILDTIQDAGRYGYQNLGINPSGAMDRFASQLANSLIGKNKNSPVIEMHFPAPVILFEKATVICLAGADFNPYINNKEIPLHQPIVVGKSTILSFKKAKAGARCYLSVFQNFLLPRWLHSYSTNIIAEAGGFEGRKLRTDDVLQYALTDNIEAYVSEDECKILPYKAVRNSAKESENIHVIPGAEWSWLTEESKLSFLQHSFRITNFSDRMAYRLEGEKLVMKEQLQLVSSGVSFGTLQLLPNGQLILLMADHQTTGGYPKIGHVISAHLPQLAQMKPFQNISFSLTDVATAESEFVAQQKYLSLVCFAASFAIEKIFS